MRIFFITPCFSLKKYRREIKLYLQIIVMHAILGNKYGQFHLLPGGARVSSSLSSWWPWLSFLLVFSMLSSFDVRNWVWLKGHGISSAHYHMLLLLLLSYQRSQARHVPSGWVCNISFILSLWPLPHTPISNLKWGYICRRHSSNTVFSLYHLKILKESFVYKEGFVSEKKEGDLFIVVS